jgi:hypothetical protein
VDLRLWIVCTEVSISFAMGEKFTFVWLDPRNFVSTHPIVGRGMKFFHVFISPDRGIPSDPYYLLMI